LAFCCVKLALSISILRRENNFVKKSKILSSRFLTTKKSNCDHYRDNSEKLAIFEKCFGFPILDIFKNVQNPFPFLLFEKSLLLENIVKILVKICEHIQSHIL